MSGPSRCPVILAVLEDSERSALLKLSLAGKGWEVVRAHTCEQARTRMGDQPVDVLLADLVLPDGSAFGLLRAMEKRPLVAAVLTWGNQHGIRDRIFSAGFDLQLVRPATAEEIDLALRNKLEENVHAASA
jgi:DNA-binding response OmpR family regulator